MKKIERIILATRDIFIEDSLKKKKKT